MLVSQCNWYQIEAYLAEDDRAVLPIGSVEQHAYLSLATDAIVAERLAAEAAEPLGVPVFPAISYGITPSFMAYPGTISLSEATFGAMICEVLDSLAIHGFRRILVVNGHGGNAPARRSIDTWLRDNPGKVVQFHDWWKGRATSAFEKAIDPAASHASWMERFPWTDVGVDLGPLSYKPPVDTSLLVDVAPSVVRSVIGDGSYGGFYARATEEMRGLWEVAVTETRGLLDRW
jgi:creatinine amidohydrolase